ncbi:unnamed protein product [Eruca vesicaria subsp. sativa]|uniref:Uncharacterized protein n=1 Tax=Eruca vesicaria subsp. sativa TaxID=29727 RepID=A0ABC8L1J8_ERUVS|nr:unnamed protein product [Eruca vesicaria subsp. sativa]
MVEDRSPDLCLSTRVFSESTRSQSCMYQEDNDDKVTNGKRPLEVVGGEIIRPTKSLKLMGFSIVYDCDSSDYSLSGEDAANGTSQEQGQSDSNNKNGRDSTDSHSLFYEISRDNSIDCLLCCSRFDYGSIPSVNPNFRSLVKSGDIYKLRRQNGFVEHWVYFSLQLSEWVAFDPVERRCMHLPTMPPSVNFKFADKESIAVGTDLLVLGKEKLSHRAGSVNGWGLAFRACGERLIAIG